jgi:hypothetical protein
VAFLQVPFIFRVSSTSKVSLGQGNMKLDRSDKMTFETIGQAKYPWSAEVMSDYMRKTWDLDIAEIDRPSEFYHRAARQKQGGKHEWSNSQAVREKGACSQWSSLSGV